MAMSADRHAACDNNEDAVGDLALLKDELAMLVMALAASSDESLKRGFE